MENWPGRRALGKLATAWLAASVLAGCFQNQGNNLGSGRDNTNTEAQTASIRFGIGRVDVAAAQSGSSGQVITVVLDRAKTEPATSILQEVCNTSSGSVGTKPWPCVCEITWEELNQTGQTVVPVTRTVTAPVTTVQDSAAACTAPAAFGTEIPDGTTIKVTIRGTPLNPKSGSFTIPPFSKIKSGVTVSGSFQDAEGRGFDNILRYSCYEQFKRGLEIKSKRIDVANPQSPVGERAPVFLANDFCIAKPGAAPGEGCEGLSAADNSAQANFYNLYVRNTDRGGINIENKRFKCPKVRETLRSAGQAGAQNDFWPLDQSFALALTPSPQFPVGVEAFTKLGIGSGDPVTQASKCFGDGGGAASSGGGGTADNNLISACLGFAAKPAADGTCPSFRDSAGNTRFTYRLRRFIALYPMLFDADGKPTPGPQQTDTIYVLDRPVLGSPNAAKPFTMQGPKPCPFAYFDHSGVTRRIPRGEALPIAPGTLPPIAGDGEYAIRVGTAFVTAGRPGYVATSSPRWTGANVDGIQLPNMDIAGQSCSALIPIPRLPATDRISLGTINSENPAYPSLFVRPIEAWTPHYEEDNDFQACAPASSPIIDPPLHFARSATGGNVAWCAEVYPTQNTNISDLERRRVRADGGGGVGTFPGFVQNYTSHVAKNSVSPVCRPTLLNFAPLGNDYPLATGGAALQCSVANPTLDAVAQGRHPDNLLVDEHNVTGFAAECRDNGTLNGNRCLYCAGQTCDRTVQDVAVTWPRFPLLAPAQQVEQALRNDPSFNCAVTYDVGATGTPKSLGGRTPAGGCCGTAVRMRSGVDNGTDFQLRSSGAHLEPPPTQTACQTPIY